MEPRGANAVNQGANPATPHIVNEQFDRASLRDCDSDDRPWIEGIRPILLQDQCFRQERRVGDGRLEQGAFDMSDTQGQVRTGNQRLIPTAVIKGGQVYKS